MKKRVSHKIFARVDIRPKVLIVCHLLLAVFLIAPNASHALESVYTDFWGHAIRGYDPVAYFTENKPKKGTKQFSAEWNGATWLFASMENKQTFLSNPEKYAPQYGGYCSWAVSQGYTASIDPDAWSIHNNKLYLNYSKSVYSTWAANKDANIRSGDKNWPRLLKQ